ncbi:MAG: hypothetical protein GQ532_21575 [Methylomarinum sp.]|nr:hypothetical protein [Methylomarinum sp.]
MISVTGDSSNANSVTVVITGTDGSTSAALPAQLSPDGTWSVDVSGLNFSEEVSYTATATATDGTTPVTASDTDSFELAPTVTVDLDINNDGTVISVTGDSSNASSVTVVITGSDGSTSAALPALLSPDGTWSVDVSGLDFSEEVSYTATATATDGTTPVTANDTDSFDLINISSETAHVNEAALDLFPNDDNDLFPADVTGSDPTSRAETVTGQLDFSITQGTASVTGIVAGDSGSVPDENVSTIINGAYGSIKVEANGSYTYTLTSNTTNHSTQGTGSDGVQDVFSFAVTDSNGNVATSTIKIDIIDDVPQAIDNTETLTFTGTLFDSVIDNARNFGDSAPDDSLGADDAKLTSVSFDGVTKEFISPGDILHFETDNGALDILDDGRYRYVSSNDGIETDQFSGGTEENWSGVNLFAFNGSESHEDASGQLVLNGTANIGYVENSADKSGIGVKGTDAGQKTDAIDDGETLVMELGHSTSSLDLTLTQFNASQGEQATWSVYDETHTKIASGDFTGASFDSNGKGATLNIDLPGVSETKYIAISYESSSNSGQGIIVAGVSYDYAAQPVEDTFNYQLVDGDGDISTADLTISQVIGEINTGILTD